MIPSRASTRFFRLLVLGCVAGSSLLPQALLAQSPIVPADDDEAAILEHLSARGDCLEQYNFGNVSVDFSAWEEQASAVLTPGSTLRVSGVLRNENEYPLAQGRLFARVLKYSGDDVAMENWHPIVSESFIPGDFSLARKGQVPFTFAWAIPAKAPAGLYSVEFSYLAGQRYVIAGIPYVSNFSAGSILFQVESSAVDTSVVFPEFDRRSVTLNGAPLTLRSVPPSVPATAPVTTSSQLTNSGAVPIPVTITSALYEWSDSDGKPPVLSSSQQVTLAPGQNFAVPWNWETPQTGVYELVHTAVPQDVALLPSIIKIRFPVEGNRPRIIFSGVTGIDESEVLVTTCAVNGTVGDGKGSIETTVLTGSNTIGQVSGETTSSQLGSVKLSIPRDNFSENLTVQTTLKDDKGVVTDSNVTTYAPELLLGPAAQASDGSATTVKPWYWYGVGIAVLLVMAIVAIFITRSRRRTHL